MDAVGNTIRTVISNKPNIGRWKVSGDAAKRATCILLALEAVGAGTAIVGRVIVCLAAFTMLACARGAIRGQHLKAVKCPVDEV